MSPPSHSIPAVYRDIVSRALDEDLGAGDLTTQGIWTGRRTSAGRLSG